MFIFLKRSVNSVSSCNHYVFFFQGLVGGMTLSLLYYSFRELPLGDATTIIFSSPVIVIALSFLFLKEPCGVLRIVVVCTLFAGVILVARPPFLFQVIESKKILKKLPKSDRVLTNTELLIDEDNPDSQRRANITTVQESQKI